MSRCRTNSLVLAVDAGNTRTDVALVDCRRRIALNRELFPSRRIHERLVPSLKRAAGERLGHVPLPVAMSACLSVDRKKQASDLRNKGFHVHMMKYNNDCPVSVQYNPPGRLGTDRIADCVFARIACPGRNAVLIDAGTAVTVNYLRRGKTFIGGVILAGPSRQLESLARLSPALPPIDLDATETVFPFTSTIAGMAAGARMGTAAALDGFVKRGRKALGAGALVLATGGAWRHVRDFVSFEARYIPDMTVVGVALWGKSVVSGEW